jgi:glutamate racemase
LNDRPLGVFDSGLGGLSVVRALWHHLPSESIVYFGDTGRFPYGTRSPEVIRRFSRQNAAFLLEQGCKAVVVACNTASAHALKDLVSHLQVPVIGVVEPGVEAALAAHHGGRLGLLATSGTVASGAYAQALQARRPDLDLVSIAAPLFVALVEEGWTNTPATELIAREYTKGFSPGPFDAVILGCTHFPLLRPVLSKVLGPAVSLVDAAEATASAVAALLRQKGLERAGGPPQHEYFVSDAPEKFETLGPLFLGTHVKPPRVVQIESY